MRTQRPLWVQLETVELCHHIQWRLLVEGSKEEYESLYISTLRKRLDTIFSNLETRPAWRMVVLRPKGELPHLDLKFVWNHPIADGMSGKIFHEIRAASQWLARKTPSRQDALRFVDIANAAPGKRAGIKDELGRKRLPDLQFQKLVAACIEHGAALRHSSGSGTMPVMVESSAMQARSGVLKDVYLEGIGTVKDLSSSASLMNRIMANGQFSELSCMIQTLLSELAMKEGHSQFH